MFLQKMWYHKDNTRGRQNKVPIGKEKNPRLRLVNASPFFDARGLCLCIQPVGHRGLAVAVGGAAGQGQRQGIFAGGQKPRQREFVRRPEGKRPPAKRRCLPHGTGLCVAAFAGYHPGTGCAAGKFQINFDKKEGFVYELHRTEGHLHLLPRRQA